MQESQKLSAGFLGLSHLHPRGYMTLFRAIPEAAVIAAADANPVVLEGFQPLIRDQGYC